VSHFGFFQTKGQDRSLGSGRVRTRTSLWRG